MTARRTMSSLWQRIFPRASPDAAGTAGYPNTFIATSPNRDPKVFDPALKHFLHGFRTPDARFDDPAVANAWHHARRQVMDHILRTLLPLKLSLWLVFRGSLLLRTWFGDGAREPGDLDCVV